MRNEKPGLVYASFVGEDGVLCGDSVCVGVAIYRKAAEKLVRDKGWRPVDAHRGPDDEWIVASYRRPPQD